MLMRRAVRVPVWAAMASVLLPPRALVPTVAFLAPVPLPSPMRATVRRRSSSDPPPPPDDGLASLRVPALKDRLRARGLRVGGRKAELVARLRAASDGARGGGPAPAPLPSATAPAAHGAVPPGAVAILACKS